MSRLVIGALPFLGAVLAQASRDTPQRPGHCLADLPGTIQWATRNATSRLVDDSSGPDPDSWAPWTQQPACLQSQHNHKSRFCTFSDAGYGSYGISLITSPEVAAASADMLQDPYMSSIPAHDIDPVLLGGREPSPPYEIVDIPGKGKGVVATRPIKRYEVFMGDYAAMVIHASFPGSVQQIDGYGMLHLAADQLREPEALLGLGRSSPGYKSDIVEDIMRTNSFQMMVAGQPHMAMFPEISRLNHACNPSAFMRFSESSSAATVIAFRDIEPGEEITISYARLGMSHQERQTLLTDWGFKCTCDMCTAHPSVVAASDNRRAKITQLKTDILDYLDRGKVHGAVKMIREVIDVMEKENLRPLMTEQYETLARIQWALGAKEKGVKYARKSIQLLTDHGFMDPRDFDENLMGLLYSFEG
ncbi:hypothetical protein F5X68DRAFT_247852 [Plectosphaerella plurivora]|uniref:SET domain-containing protein n=1 Tax=Plectosphaerella plurivora TaxID=936078 RepID=A0A9P8VHF2_9PEZI|nr:hypothetical protein F5X68DRAFT_247852 [Plectosphaerella plurivora]